MLVKSVLEYCFTNFKLNEQAVSLVVYSVGTERRFTDQFFKPNVRGVGVLTVYLLRKVESNKFKAIGLGQYSKTRK